MTFRLGITRDLLTSDGSPSFGLGPLELLKQETHIDWEFIDETVTEITPDIMARYDGLHVNSPAVTAQSVARSDCRVRLVSRHGVGYDSVDVAALAAKGILTTNTPIAVRRPVAVASLTMIFALAGRLFAKDNLIRQGEWNTRTNHMGLGLTTRTLGVLGAGGIGLELLALARPFGWKMLACDPFANADAISACGASLVDLDTLLAQSDFLVTTLVLNEQTRHIINRERLSKMKSSAFLINMARGPIVDELALIDALNQGVIAGAGLDVFEKEPIQTDNPLLKMRQVLLTPHSLCWTDECFDHIAREGLGCQIAFAKGLTPLSVVRV
jgi:D-3-phosphoglycerate dehydrogenase